MRPRNQQLQAGKVTTGDGQVGNRSLIEDLGYVGAIGLELRQFAGDFNGLRRCTDLQLEIDLGRSVGGDLDSFVLLGLETGRGGRDVVDVGNEMLDRILALGDSRSLEPKCSCSHRLR